MRQGRVRHLLSISLVVMATCLAAAAQGGPSRPDLIIDPNDLARDITVGFRHFPPGHCAVQEGCIGGPGVRKLLVFTVTTANISQEALSLGDPTNNPLYELDQCHGHYHLHDFSTYELTDGSGSAVGASTKSDWCLIDIEPYLNEPWVPPFGSYSCSDQGISPGWADVYEHSLDCQWVDVTGLPAGDYTLSATVNPIRKIRESDYSNNTSQVPVTLPDLSGVPDLTIVQSQTVATLELQKRFVSISDPDAVEGCLEGGEYRKFFKFSTYVANESQNDLFIGDPNSHPLVTFSSPHGHYHLENFLLYEIKDTSSSAVLASTTQDYWFPKDREAHLTDPWVSPVFFYYWVTSAYPINPGIQRGWRGVAQKNVDRCQVLDVTDLPAGLYNLAMTVNPLGAIPETDLTNNSLSVPVFTTDPLDGIGHRPDGVHVPGNPLRVEHDPAGTRLIYDVSPSACPAADFNLYYSLKAPGTYQYDAAICDIGASGDVVLPVPDPSPGKLLWMILVGRDGAREGGHGFDGQGIERPLTGISQCGITESVPRPPCL